MIRLKGSLSDVDRTTLKQIVALDDQARQLALEIFRNPNRREELCLTVEQVYTELQSLSSLPIAKRDDVAMVLSEAILDAAYALRGSATTSMRLGRVISRERQAEQQEMK
jgi:hypothetical protein